MQTLTASKSLAHAQCDRLAARSVNFFGAMTFRETAMVRAVCRAEAVRKRVSDRGAVTAMPVSSITPYTETNSD